LAETSELILVRGPLDGVGLAWPLVPWRTRKRPPSLTAAS